MRIDGQVRCTAAALGRWLVLGGAALAASGALAFDAGHHFDLTEAVLREEGFGRTPLQVVQVANWLTDYYAASPVVRDSVKEDAGKLHFDNLYDTADVDRYWARLTGNARDALREAALADDPLTFLTVLGMLLHASQDFAAHSNWVEVHPPDASTPYRRETFLADGAPEGARVFTGTYPPYPAPPPLGNAEHGDYDSGLNKDSHDRPLWEEAYVSAYCSTHELVSAAQAWAEAARPGFWAATKEYTLPEILQKRVDRDVEAARNISMWIVGKNCEGHWKGSESGSTRRVSVVALEWTTSPPSPVAQKVKEVAAQARLTAGLYGTAEAPSLPRTAGFDADRVVVEVGITYLAEKRGGGRRIDRTDRADLYAVTTIGPQRYVDRVVRGHKRFNDPWMTVHLADGDEEEIAVRLEIWDQDESRRRDDLCDVNPAAGRRRLEFTVRVRDDLLRGDVAGIYNSPERTFEIAGAKPDDMRVLVRGYVRTRRLRPR